MSSPLTGSCWVKDQYTAILNVWFLAFQHQASCNKFIYVIEMFLRLIILVLLIFHQKYPGDYYY